MKSCREQLVLIDRDEVDAGTDCGPPPLPRGLLRSEVVTRRPAFGIVLRIVAVQRVEPNPQAGAMCRLHKVAETHLIGRSPRTRAALTADLNDAPGIVPPPVIVRAEARRQVGQFFAVSHARFSRSSRLPELRPCRAEHEKT